MALPGMACPRNGVKGLHGSAAMESHGASAYLESMAHDLATLLSAAFKDIRRSRARTQEKWEELSGMSQTWTSDVETGRHGFDSLRKIGGALERAGVDPVELLRVALAHASDLSDEDRDLVALVATADPDEKRAVTTLLRRRTVGVERASR
jgi:transcriptional regulator with XRE-family HTH domain